MTIRQANSNLAPVAIIICLTLVCAWFTYKAAFQNKSTPKFTVNSLISSKNRLSTITFSQIDLRLSPELTEAVNNGVPIYITIEHAFPRPGLLKQVYKDKQRQRFRLERHALSDKYILSELRSNRLQNFDSISGALTYLGQSFKISLDNSDEYDQIAIRAYVDLKQLPSALRLQHLFSKAWLHDSGWSIWPLSS